MIAAESTQTLLTGLEDALSRADRSQPTRLVSATVEVEQDVDPAAIAAGSRLAADRWFCWEQPDRGFAVAGVGSAIQVVSSCRCGSTSSCPAADSILGMAGPRCRLRC